MRELAAATKLALFTIPDKVADSGRVVNLGRR